MSDKIRVHASPLTGTIFAGVPLKNGVWGKNKTDVTMDALCAVIEHIIIFGKPVIISSENNKPLYKITVEKMEQKQNG